MISHFQLLCVALRGFSSKKRCLCVQRAEEAETFLAKMLSSSNEDFVSDVLEMLCFQTTAENSKFEMQNVLF